MIKEAKEFKLNTDEIIKTIEFSQMWDKTEFGTIHEEEYKLLEKLSKREIVTKTREDFYTLNYSLSELKNIYDTPFSLVEMDKYDEALKENETKKYNTLFNFITLVHSSITKFESKVFLKLLTLEMNENKTHLTQSDLLDAYNKEYFDEDPDFDKSIKQSQLSRALKNLKSNSFIKNSDIEKEILIYVNWDKFRVNNLS